MKVPEISEGDPSPIRRHDWSFDEVPDDEIIACCLWEYARESKSIHIAAADWWHEVGSLPFPPTVKLPSDFNERVAEKTARLCRNVDADRPAAKLIFDRLLSNEFIGTEIFYHIATHITAITGTWQDMDAGTKEYFRGKISQSFLYHPFKTALVGELETLWNAHNEDLLLARNGPQDEDSDSEMAALHSEVSPIGLDSPEDPRPGEFVHSFIADFSRFTDQEMLEAFANWLKRHRPVEWQNPRRIFPNSKQKGRKILDYRAALDRIGLMRLLHWYSPNDLEQNQPEAWKKFGRKAGSFRREVRAAGDFLFKLFPFLPESERPISEQRLAVWIQETMDDLDKMEAERGGEWEEEEGGATNPP